MFTQQKKFQYPLTLDLQLFAKSATVDGETFEIDDEDTGDDSFDQDDDDALDDIEVGDDDYSDEDTDDLEDDEDSVDADDDQDDEAEDDSDDETEVEENVEGNKPDNTIAKAVIAERKRLQAQMEELRKETSKKGAALEKLMKIVGVDDLGVLQERLDAVEAQRIAQASNGTITPEQAAAQIRTQRELERQQSEIRKLKYSQEVATLKADPFFADVEDYREQLEALAERTGMSLKQAYLAERGETRMKEYAREVEQRTLANKNKRQKAKVDTSSNGEAIKKEKYDLTPDQLAVAKATVKMGTFKNVAEYAKFLKKK